MTIRTIKPAEDLRTRAEEIVTAYDKWDNRKKPRGHVAAKRAFEKADRHERRLAERVQALQATTVEGLIAKARCAEIYDFDDCAGVAASIGRDLMSLRGAGPAQRV